MRTFARRARRALGFVLGTGLAALAWPSAEARAEEPAFTEDFRLEDCRFDDEGDNPFFPLEEGVFQRLEGDSDGEAVVVLNEVTRKTRKIRLEIDGEPRTVRTRVVRSTEWVDGELFEISFNFFAVCEPRGDVLYFGEDVFFYEDGEVVSMDGSWRAGRDGAQPGLIMPGTFLLGSRYQQEQAPGIAEDRGENVDMGLEVEVPAGVFSDCVEVLDTNPLEPGSEGDTKIYCDGVGLTVDEDVELVRFRAAGDDDDD
jgi:hypothetical protein